MHSFLQSFRNSAKRCSVWSQPLASGVIPQQQPAFNNALRHFVRLPEVTQGSTLATSFAGLRTAPSGAAWGLQQRGFAAPASEEALTVTPRTEEQFAIAEAQFSQIVTDEDRASAGDVSEEALDNGKVFHVMGQIPDLSYVVPQKEVFAVVQIGAHQHKVTTDDVIYVEKLKKVDIHDKLLFPQVLLFGSRSETVIGRPVVPRAAVIAVVEQQTRDAKVIIFKKRRRKNYRKHAGHRQELTMLRILDIVGVQ